MKPLLELLPASRVKGAKVPLDAVPSALVQSTKELVPGCAFFALRGSRSDGHDFVAQAVAQGALAVVVESPEVFAACHRAILVDSSRRAFGEAVSTEYGNPTSGLELVGITGTNGKTTTAFLLRDIWSQAGQVTGLVGTVHNEIAGRVEPSGLTTPDAPSLQELFRRMVDGGVRRVAMEVSSIALDQWRVAGCRFEVALFTNLTQDHLDYHGTMDAYFGAKRRLFAEFLPGVSVVNLDDEAGRQIFESLPKRALSFSLRNPKADVHAVGAEFSPEGIRAVVQTPQGRVPMESPLMGVHNLSNCLGALAAQIALGESAEHSAGALASARGAPGRLERVAPAKDRPYVFVDYAHTEDALRRVLECLNQVRGKGSGRIVTVFGCGGDRDRSKRPRMAAVAERLSDKVVATSDNPRTEAPDAILADIAAGFSRRQEVIFEPDRRLAIHAALEVAGSGDFVLIAGKGHEDYQILGTTKVPFDDRIVVSEYYGQKTR